MKLDISMRFDWLQLNGFEVTFYALALAFCWVNYIQPILPFKSDRKPWNCLKCMTGWFSMVLALLSGYNGQSLFYLAIGVFVGAMVEGITMRYL